MRAENSDHQAPSCTTNNKADEKERSCKTLTNDCAVDVKREFLGTNMHILSPSALPSLIPSHPNSSSGEDARAQKKRKQNHFFCVFLWFAPYPFRFSLFLFLLYCLVVSADSSLQNPLLDALSSSSISDSLVDSETAANTLPASTQSIEEETTETPSSQQHQGLYTIIDGPFAEGSSWIFNIKNYFDLDHLEAALGYYDIGAVTDITGRDGRSVARIEEWVSVV